MDCKLTSADIGTVEADAAIGFMPESGDSQSPAVMAWSARTGGLVGEIVDRGEFRGKHQSTILIHKPAGLPAGRLVLAGCGDPAKLGVGALRDAAGAAWRKLRAVGVRSVVASVPVGIEVNAGVRAVAEGILLADYEPDAYKTAARKRSALESVIVSAQGAFEGAFDSALDSAVAIASAQNSARELANEPGNLLPPETLADRASALVQGTGLECEVLDRSRLEALNMGALLGVARGSREPPVMILVRYRPEGVEPGGPHLGLVGKAVTFDTGGISLKPSADMHLMKHDMAGGATMLGAMLALGQLHPNIPVTAVIPSVENMPGGEAQRPGDVVTTRSGKTVEVLNTDAEGRLILADALCYARQLGCTHLVDAATLTGAIVVALGHHYTGLFGNDNAWAGRVVQASSRAGEKMWRMPLGPEYTRQLDSPIADLANIGPRWGGAVTAAAFLEQFAEGTPWVHLDIAGTAWYEKALPHAPVGPSGVGVATLVDLAMEFA